MSGPNLDQLNKLTDFNTTYETNSPTIIVNSFCRDFKAAAQVILNSKIITTDNRTLEVQDNFLTSEEIAKFAKIAKQIFKEFSFNESEADELLPLMDQMHTKVQNLQINNKKQIETDLTKARNNVIVNEEYEVKVESGYHIVKDLGEVNIATKITDAQRKLGKEKSELSKMKEDVTNVFEKKFLKFFSHPAVVLSSVALWGLASLTIPVLAPIFVGIAAGSLALSIGKAVLVNILPYLKKNKIAEFGQRILNLAELKEKLKDPAFKSFIEKKLEGQEITLDDQQLKIVKSAMQEWNESQKKAIR